MDAVKVFNEMKVIMKSMTDEELDTFYNETKKSHSILSDLGNDNTFLFNVAQISAIENEMYNRTFKKNKL